MVDYGSIFIGINGKIYIFVPLNILSSVDHFHKDLLIWPEKGGLICIIKSL